MFALVVTFRPMSHCDDQSIIKWRMLIVAQGRVGVILTRNYGTDAIAVP